MTKIMVHVKSGLEYYCNVFLCKFLFIPFDATRKMLLSGKELFNVSMLQHRIHRSAPQ